MSEDDPIMQDEIFGPLLPTITLSSVEEAVEFINDRPKPLALYLFSKNNKNIEYVQYNTSSGAYTTNDVMVHAACNTLPFGGVGPSGIGGYHGKHSFDTFSHLKPVMIKYPGLEGLNAVRTAPFDKKKQSSLLWFLDYPTSLKEKSSFVKPAIAATAIVAIAYFSYQFF